MHTCNVASNQFHESAFGDRFEARSSLVAIDALPDEVQLQLLGRLRDEAAQYPIVGLRHGWKTGSESKMKKAR